MRYCDVVVGSVIEHLCANILNLRGLNSRVEILEGFRDRYPQFDMEYELKKDLVTVGVHLERLTLHYRLQ